jgi:hypothetical protein
MRGRGTIELRASPPVPLLALPALVLIAVLMAHSDGAVAADSPRPGQRVETSVRSTAPDRRQVKESYVRVYDPLPESAGAHPPECDWIGYLRLRNAKGPRKATRADAVLVSMPGFLGGAASFDQVGRNVVVSAARKRRNVEVWALDRRSNCLEDHLGVEEAARRGDARIAYEYYFYGREVRGRRFGGFKTAEDARFLDNVGLAQTLRDQYTVIRYGMPARLRTRKLICGGHSLGGPLTAAFAGWDFDGNPDTTADAGFNQCAAFFGLDTSFSFGGSDSSSGGPTGVGAQAALASGSGGSPFIDAPPVTPETLQVLAPNGVAAYQQPDQESVLTSLIPNTPEFELTLRLLFSRDAVNFATGSPSVRDFRLTNEVVVAGVFDDNSSPISIFRSSIGTYDGGPVAQKNFPTPGGSSAVPGLGPSAGLVAGGRLMVPETPHGPLYRWRDYDRIGARDAPVQVDDSGRHYTWPATEVSDIHQLARAMFEAPADFVEQYFPTRIMSDVVSAQSGDRSGELQNLRYDDGVTRRPSLLVNARDGIGTAPSGEGGTRVVTLSGYDHLDVVTAARRQNNGRSEGSSTTLRKFALKVAVPRRTGR